MPPAMSGQIFRPPQLKMPSAVETGVEWLHAGALAPRTNKGSKYRRGAGVDGSGGGASPTKSPNKWGLHMGSPFGGRFSSHGSGGSGGESLLSSARGRQRERRTPTGRVRRRSASRRSEELAAPATTPHTSARGHSAKTPGTAGAERHSSGSARRADSFNALNMSSGSNSDGFDSGRRILGVKTPAPKEGSKSVPGSFHKKAPDSSVVALPFTPLPAQPPGEAAIRSWIEVAGLEHVGGLLDGFLEIVEDLSQLKTLSDPQIMTVIGGLRPKLRGLTVRKILAAVQTLRAEASAFQGRGETACDLNERPLAAPLDLELEAVVTSDASSVAAMPPPARPQLGGGGARHEARTRGDHRRGIAPSHVHPQRFRPRTEQADLDAAALTAEEDDGYGSAAEAEELTDLADLFGSGAVASKREENTHAAAKAAAKAAVAAAAAAKEAAANATEKMTLAAQASPPGATGLYHSRGPPLLIPPFASLVTQTASKRLAGREDKEQLTPRTKQTEDNLLVLDLQASALTHTSAVTTRLAATRLAVATNMPASLPLPRSSPCRLTRARLVPSRFGCAERARGCDAPKGSDGGARAKPRRDHGRAALVARRDASLGARREEGARQEGPFQAWQEQQARRRGG